MNILQKKKMEKKMLLQQQIIVSLILINQQRSTTFKDSLDSKGNFISNGGVKHLNADLGATCEKNLMNKKVFFFKIIY